MSTYAIYDHPPENPDDYVCVKWDADAEGNIRRDRVICKSNDLGFIREKLTAMGLLNIGNQWETDPVILEVWM